ncbi:MAG: flagellin [Phycisphaerales bacterium]
MGSFPANIGRVPMLLKNRTSLAFMGRTNLELFNITRQLSTGVAIGRFSDDPIKAATISAIDSRLERSDQKLQNLQYAAGSLDTLDSTLSEIQDLVNEAKSLASSQIDSTASDSERHTQASVVDSLIASLLRLSNQESLVGHVFGGTRPGTPPIQNVDGAYRYVGGIGGLLTDLGLGSTVPVTLGANNVIGDVSNRVVGSVDLDPDLTLSTKLSDLRGANGQGIQKTSIDFSFNGGVTASVDISQADTIGDVADAITAAIHQYETDNGVTILGPGGVSISGDSLTLDVPSGSLTFSDPVGGTAGSDLGIVFDPPTAFDSGNAVGASLDPKLTWTTTIASLQGITPPLGELQITNNARTVNVDLSGATTLADIRSAIEASVPGTRVIISDDGRGISVVTEIAGGADRALSITDVNDGTATATALGIRSYMDTTSLSDFNDGRGVQVLSGRTDPTTGLLDPALNVDFTITLGDGFEIDIDLQPTDVADVGSLLAAINAQADAALTAAGRATTDFDASLPPDRNGLMFVQDGAIGGNLSVERKNNSPAAQQLGLLDTTLDPSGNVLYSKDVAKVRVDNLFTHLIDLRDALLNNDISGIQFAAEKIGSAATRLIETHGLVGGYARRVDDESRREEERVLLDESLRSKLRDTDYAEAATRLTMLQTQLAATLQITAGLTQLSLLNYL